MVDKKTAAPSPEEKKSSSLVAATSSMSMTLGDVDADFLGEVASSQGAGLSSSASDNIVPFIAVLQDMSPEVKKRDPQYVEGAEVGMFLNKATRQLWPAESGELESSLVVQPCAFQQMICEWVPRDAGGGLVARYELDGTPEETMRRVGGEEKIDPRDSKGQKKVWKMPNGNDLIHTRYHYVNILHPDGRVSPAVLSFSSTGHGSSRRWMTLMNEALVPDGRGGAMKAPSWFRAYKLRSVTRSNSQGEWFVVEVDVVGWIKQAHVRQSGKELFEAIGSGTLTAGDEGGAAAPANQPAQTGDLPI